MIFRYVMFISLFLLVFSGGFSFHSHDELTALKRARPQMSRTPNRSDSSQMAESHQKTSGTLSTTAVVTSPHESDEKERQLQAVIANLIERRDQLLAGDPEHSSQTDLSNPAQHIATYREKIFQNPMMQKGIRMNAELEVMERYLHILKAAGLQGTDLKEVSGILATLITEQKQLEVMLLRTENPHIIAAKHAHMIHTTVDRIGQYLGPIHIEDLKNSDRQFVRENIRRQYDETLEFIDDDTVRASLVNHLMEGNPQPEAKDILETGLVGIEVEIITTAQKRLKKATWEDFYTTRIQRIRDLLLNDGAVQSDEVLRQTIQQHLDRLLERKSMQMELARDQ